MTRHLLSQVRARENRKHILTHKLVHTRSQQPKGETTPVFIRDEWVSKMQCVCVCVCVRARAHTDTCMQAWHVHNGTLLNQEKERSPGIPHHVDRS